MKDVLVIQVEKYIIDTEAIFILILLKSSFEKMFLGLGGGDIKKIRRLHMNYGFELMSEIIPLCIVAVLGIDMKKGGEKIFTIYYYFINHRNPNTDCNTFCMFIKIPQSNSRHIMATALLLSLRLYMFFVEKKIEILFI